MGVVNSGAPEFSHVQLVEGLSSGSLLLILMCHSGGTPIPKGIQGWWEAGV